MMNPNRLMYGNVCVTCEINYCNRACDLFVEIEGHDEAFFIFMDHNHLYVNVIAIYLNTY